MHGRLPSATLLCFTRSALDKLVRVPLLALLSCMTLHIKSLMYAWLLPIYNSGVFHPLCLRQACQGTFAGPGLMHDTAYQVSDVCIVASRLQTLLVSMAQVCRQPVIPHCDTACWNIGLQSSILHSDRITSSLSLCCLSVIKHAYRLECIAGCPGIPDWIQGFGSVSMHMSSSLDQTSLVRICQPDLTASLPPCFLLHQASAEALLTAAFLRASSDGMQVAKTVDISHVSPLLAQLGAYDGMVTLALAKAKALDPEVVAAQKSEAGRLAREVICCRAYSPQTDSSGLAATIPVSPRLTQ